MYSGGLTKFRKSFVGFSISLSLALFSVSCMSGQERLFIVGQDLGSVREYLASDCCPRPDGNTAYLSFYNLMSEETGFGGLGIERDGKPIEREFDWGGGPVNAWKSATEFGPIGLAIGLSLVENEHPGALDRLVAGDYDENIRQLARFFSMIDNTVYLRIGYEFDGFWNQGYEDTGRYIAAYRRIVDGLRAENVRNVHFVWQASVFPLDEMVDGRHDDLRNWYPGDEYVDWMAFSLFAGLDEKPGVVVEKQPPTAREMIDELLELARERGKPVMVAEASPQGYDLARGTHSHIGGTWDGPQGEGRKAVSPQEVWDSWYQPLFDYLHENRDVVQALAYINCHWDSQDLWDPPYEGGYWGDSRLQVSPELANRFTAAVANWKEN